MSWRRVVAVFLGGLLMALLLGACGGLPVENDTPPDVWTQVQPYRL